jgi:hypothetical protein
MLDRESLASFGAPTLEHEPAAFGFHPLAEAVRLGALTIIWLIGSLHGESPFLR